MAGATVRLSKSWNAGSTRAVLSTSRPMKILRFQLFQKYCFTAPALWEGGVFFYLLSKLTRAGRKMQAAHKKITKRPLTKRVKWFTIIPPSGEMDLTCFPAGTESARKEVGMDAAALCYPRGTLSLQAFGVYCAQFCCLTGRTMAATACSPSFAWQTVVFLYPFL